MPAARFHGQIVQGKEVKIFEHTILLISVATILIPMSLAITFYHPAEPLHRIFEDLLEVKVELSMEMFVVSCCYVVCGLSSGNIVAVYLGIGFIHLAFFALWLKAILPKETSNGSGNGINITNRYRTNQLGSQPANKLIQIYRCVELQCIYLNVFFAKIRVAAHCLFFLVLLVLGTFLLVRYGDNLVEKKEYVFIAFIVCFATIPVIAMKIESSTFGDMVDDCDNFKKILMKTNERKREVWKKAISLRPVIIRSTHPFFNINHGLKCWKCKPDGKCNQAREGVPVECDNGICFTEEIRNLYEGYNIVKDCETRGELSNTKTGSCDNPIPEMTKCYCRNADNCNQFKIELVDELGNEVATKGSISSSGIVGPSSYPGFSIGFTLISILILGACSFRF
ncbi:unnamed protein product [Orchesella dallaii]|uniref:Uncharacterized protein n=1 Tax=Orchesella dallaii TaxID=48710 RepID=A0ABP1PUG4_9HEXA